MRMKPFALTLAALVLFATAAFTQGDIKIVEKAKADLVAAGADLSGPCGAFRITNLVAWRLRPAYGFLVKKGGNRAIVLEDGRCVTEFESNAPGYATDYLINATTKYGYDILSDGGTANGPQDFNDPETAADMVARNKDNFAEPFDWAIVVDPTDPVDPDPTDPPLDLLARVKPIDKALSDAIDVINTIIEHVKALEEAHGPDDQAVADLSQRLSQVTADVHELKARPVITGCKVRVFGVIAGNCQVQ